MQIVEALKNHINSDGELRMSRAQTINLLQWCQAMEGGHEEQLVRIQSMSKMIEDAEEKFHALFKDMQELIPSLPSFR